MSSKERGLMDHIIAKIADEASILWFVLLGLWGGTANYIGRLKRDKQPFSIVELIGEWSISGFSGLMTAYLAVNLELSFALTSVAAGIGGHMGGRAVYVIQQIIESKTGINKNDNP